MKSDVFRKSAVEKMASPDALDKNIQVVSMHGWLALFCTIVLIIITVVWSFTGNISTFVDSSGIVMYGSGIENIIATESGTVTDLNIEIGDLLQKNTTIARINKVEISEEINQYKDYCDEIEAFRTSKFSDSTILSYDMYSLFEENVVNYISAGDDAAKNIFYNKINNMCDVLIKDYNDKISELQKDLINKSSITMQSNGKVLEVYKKVGDYIQVGDVIASVIVQKSIDTEDQTQSMNNEVIVYVPVSDGKKIIKGMEVQVSPSTVDKEKYGCIVGVVKSFSEYAVSEESMMSVLNNELLVDNISTGEALIEIHIELLKDSSTVSKYKWTTKNGAPVTIAPGTVCSARIEIGSSKPVEIIFPFVKTIFENNDNAGEQE